MKDLILVCGSESDKENANKILKVWKEIGLDYRVSIASCHKHGGGDFEKFILEIEEKFIVFLGGMSLAAPGLIEVFLKKAKKFDSIVFGIPTDKAAQSAIEDLPKGTAIITGGLNQVSLSHSLINSALACARLAGMFKQDKKIWKNLEHWYGANLAENPLRTDIKLNDKGLLP